MLKLVNHDRVSPVTVLDDVILDLISLSVIEKEALILKVANITATKDSSAIMAMIEIVAPAIQRIHGPGIPDGVTVSDLLTQIEDMEELQAVVKAVCEHCSLTPAESKNSSSLSVQPIPDSAGSVVETVKPEDVPVSTTQTRMEA